MDTSAETGSTNPNQYNFEYTGDKQVWTVPESGIYKLEAWGAQGGSRNDSTQGGKGGFAAGEIYLEKGEEIVVFVGGDGNEGKGYNGGGTAGYPNIYGGGSTDFRVGGESVFQRILVAGGGGSVGGPSQPGGAGGGETGLTGSGNGTGGDGGTQSASTGTNAGSFGQGGNGTSINGGYGGAGGGGWFGGSGVFPDGSADNDRGGGGGSGYVLTTDSHKPAGYSINEKYYFEKTYDNITLMSELYDGNTRFFGVNGIYETGHAGHGYARITKYTNNFEDDATVDAILIDDEPLANFDKNTFEYTIPVDAFFTGDKKIEVKRQYLGQVITNESTVTVNDDRTETMITVASYDGLKNATYKIIFAREKSTKLQRLAINETAFLNGDVFDKDKTEYTVNAKYIDTLTLDYKAFYAGTDITVGGLNQNTNGNYTISLNVEAESVEPTLYKINVVRDDEVFNFDYIGKIQKWIAPKDGVYKFETWGAQGGNHSNLVGGKGGYAYGELYLEKGTVLYINVGGNGNEGKGYNGGGYMSGYSTYAGGATDFRVEKDNLYSRILVAGGGGSSSPGYGTAGGYGGGITSGGYPGASQNSGASFGNGQSSYYGAGGGGWYGGGYSNGSVSSGGSGYALTQDSYKPVNYIVDNEYYFGQTYDQLNGFKSDAKTIAGNQKSPSVDGLIEVGHEGHGYAKITFYNDDFASESRLDNIYIDDQPLVDFNPDVKEYTYKVDPLYAGEKEITVKTKNSNQLVTGDVGKVTIDRFDKDLKIYVKSVDDSATTEYTIHVEHENTSLLYSLQVNEIAFSDGEVFARDKFEYNVNGYLADNLTLSYDAYDKNATVSVGGLNNQSKTESFDITVTVSAPNVDDTVYTIHVNRDKNGFEFDYQGKVQKWIVPRSGLYRLETWGAQGGGYSSYIGGKGGYSYGEVYLEKGTVMYVNVGGNGNEGKGFNGGGSMSAQGIFGGGASDVRVEENNYLSRIIVAGGGGSASHTWYYNGGYAGGLNGNGYNPGTQTGGFSFGNGQSNHYGAGGGGWYGGGYGNGGIPGGGSGYVLTNDSYKPTNYAVETKYYFDTTDSEGIERAYDTIDGSQKFIAPNGNYEVGHSGHGYARITYYDENYASDADLDGILIDGVKLETFDPKITTYNIEVESHFIGQKEVNVIKKYPNQEVTGEAIIDFDYHNRTVTITSMAADKNPEHTKTYTINFIRKDTSKLYALEVEGLAFSHGVNFELDKYEYEVNAVLNENLKVNATTFDEDATFEVINLNASTTESYDIQIKVTEPNVEETIYTIHVKRDDKDFNFDFQGKVQKWIVPRSGMYKLETWGAQGGSYSSYKGGKGGYSYGEVYLEKGTVMYVNVGGNGNEGKGFNGGGSMAAQGIFGGGASDVRVEENDFLSRIIVAGGGGSASYNWNSHGGYAGGQNASGYNAGTQTGGYSFGNGQTNHYGAGGGGWYGGGYVNGNYTPGGGSGYILTGSSSKPSGYKAPATYNLDLAYSGYSNFKAEPGIYAGNQKFVSVNGDYETGHEGNGYVRISYLDEEFIKDVTLDNIFVDDIAVENFDPNVFEYEVTIPAHFEGKKTITYIKSNSNQTVENAGDVEFVKHDLIHKIKVFSADKSEEKEYTIHFKRENTSKLYSLEVNGFSFTNGVQFDKDRTDYEIDALITKYITLDYETYDENAEVIVDNLNATEDTTYEVSITVKAPNVADTVYTIRVRREGKAFNFEFSGVPQSWIVPETGLYKLELWGAQGSDYGAYIGGKGGYTSGELYLTKGEIVYLYVGGSGSNSQARGYNGGGSGWSNLYGGGATDIRIGGTSLYHRILVAGGGGAATNARNGGNGGGFSAQGDRNVATQTTGFSFGQGESNNSSYYAGGGGGWYGGGYGYNSSETASGGSGYVLTKDSYRPDQYAPNSKYYFGSTLSQLGNYTTKYELLDGKSAFLSPTGAIETGHQGDGYSRITYYSGGFESDATLENIYVDGIAIEEFKPDKFEYEIPLDAVYSGNKKITVSKNNLNQVVTNIGDISIPYYEKTQVITVFSADKTKQNTYTLHFKRAQSNQLQNLEVQGVAFANGDQFKNDQYEYTVNAAGIKEIKVKTQSFDEKAIVKVDDSNANETGNYDITVTVSQQGLEDVVYTVHVKRESDTYNFTVTGNEQKWIAPKSGIYRLETWGAQGADYNGYSGGKGGYAYGEIYLEKGEELSIYVGGNGNGAPGYNGGALGWSNLNGGGASDIRVGGSSLYHRILVAGGGGSASSYNRSGGAGGGETGIGDNPGTQTSGAAFGNGGSSTSSRYSAGGGGWYGGGYVKNGTAGGGSGYILTETSYKPSGYAPSSKYYFDTIVPSFNNYRTRSQLLAGNQRFISPEGQFETGHSGDGYVRITSFDDDFIHDARLDMIYVDSLPIENFDPNTFEYTVKVDALFEGVKKVEVAEKNRNQVVANTGNVEFSYHDVEHIITVVAADGKTKQDYKIHFEREHSTKLYRLSVDNHPFAFNTNFSKDVLEYTVIATPGDVVEPRYITYDETAIVTVKRLNNINSESYDLQVYVSSAGTETTTYIIHVNIGVTSYDFNYTKNVQRWIAPASGVYKLELWGASGANYSTHVGGRGGYTAGEIYLEKGEELEIYVGGDGTASSYGYNGGGSGWNNLYGGGATDIRAGGSSIYQRILVAGGGGAASYYGPGGAGGGLTGSGSNFGTQTTGASFGSGQSNNSSYYGGGGGGWFGGYASNQAVGAGGGSGYVLTKDSARPAQYAPVSKYYFGQTIKALNNYTTKYELLDGNSRFLSPDNKSEIGHAGHGFARITLYDEGFESINTVKNIFIDDEPIEGFDPNVFEYTVPLEANYVGQKTISVVKENLGQKITNDGVIDFTHHDKDHVITVESADGTSHKEYTIHFKRAHSSKLYELKVDRYQDAFTTPFRFDNYNYKLKSYIYEGIDILYKTFDKDAKVTIDGASIEELEAGDNIITITVTAPGVEPTVYKINAYRDQSVDYGFTGSAQRFVVPYSGIYRLEVWGAQGANYNSYLGGKGGYAAGELYLHKGEELNIFVGGNGSNNQGYNGGGYGWNNLYGGGATDIRVGGSSLYQRILVAGGGGAAGGRSGNGGFGGGVNGSGATQSSGYSFGNGQPNTSSYYTGGGAGWYGGSSSRTGSTGGSGYVLNADSYKPANYAPADKYYLTNSKLIGGDQEITSPNGDVLVGHAGDGYARISALSLYSTDSTLKSLNLSAGTLDQSFSPEIREYNLYLDSETTELVIDAEANDPNATLSWKNGQVRTIMPGTTQFVVPVTAHDGSVDTYRIKVTRPKSSNAELKSLSINGQEMLNQPDTPLSDDKVINYPIAYNADRKLEITGVINRPAQQVTGLGTYYAESKKPIEVTVLSEDESTVTTYTIMPIIEDSNLLETLQVDGYELEFDSSKFEYDLKVPTAVVSLDIIADAFDDEAKITINGNGYLRLGVNTITVEVDEPNIGKQVYTIRVDRTDDADGSIQKEFDFAYKGDVEAFVVPYSGKYKLEVWGAEGGNRGNQPGGKGGYASGIATLSKGETVYIYVGGAGNSYAKGYNGGGTAGYSGVYGGGASDMRIGGSTLFDRLIVAGGGGSVGASSRPGGAGGGLNGQSRSEAYGSGGQGGTQTGAGLRGSFGQGGNGSRAHNGYGGAGGGGWYGGGGVNPDYSADDDRGGGGGSGFVYIGQSGLPSSYRVENKYQLMSTSLLAGYESIPNKAGGFTTGNSGNGFARITALRQASEDNYLRELTVDHGTLSPAFDSTIQEYDLQLQPDETELSITSIPMDGVATVTGDGKYDIEPGETVIPLAVTAENGEIRTYKLTVHREASSNALVENIVINGLFPSLCSLDDDYCKLSPQFDPQVGYELETYRMIVPARIRSVEIVAIKGHPGQEVTGEEVRQLSTDSSENIFDIMVTSEDGENDMAYTFIIERDMSGNTDLEYLRLVNPEKEIEFNIDTTEYYVSVDNEYDTLSSLEFEYAALDPTASVEIIGDETLKLGLNKVIFKVTATSGESKDYTVYVYREDNSNIFLETLEVKDLETSYDLSPNYNKYVPAYLVTVPNETETVELVATAEAKETTTVMGTGTKSLEVGSNTFVIKTVAQDKTEKEYTVNVIRRKSDNAKIKTLKINGVLIDSFDPEQLVNSFEVEDDVITPQFDIELDDENANYALSGSHRRLMGGPNVVEVRVVAESGLSQVYTLNINKKISENARLQSLTTTGFDISDSFDPDVFEYDVNIPYRETPISIQAVPEHPLTKIVGNGQYYLTTGVNTLRVNSVAESGNMIPYTIRVNMLRNVNATLKSITPSTGHLDETFDPNVFEYHMNVPNSVEVLSFTAVPTIHTTTVTGLVDYKLETGENRIVLEARADSGQKVSYVINVNRDRSDNTNLKSLFVREGALEQTFKPDLLRYSTKVPYNLKSVTVDVETVDPKATYEVLNNDLKPGTNEVVVRVKPENGVGFKDYAINVYVQDKPSDNIDLSSLTISKGRLIPDFDRKHQYYTALVDYDTDSIVINATTYTRGITIEGTGEKKLKVGRNVFVVRTKDKNGVLKDHHVIINREASNEARLASLGLSGLYQSPVYFNKDNYSYSVRTYQTQIGIAARPMEANATVEILGNNDFITGAKNVVVIRVTAPDGITQREYVINVTKMPSKNNYLRSLVVNGVAIDPSFSRNRTGYKATVENSISQVTISAIPEESTAKIVSDVTQPILPGTNFVSVIVESESGVHRTYTIQITRERDTENRLSKIMVDGKELPNFDPDVLEYDISELYPYSKSTVDIDVEKVGELSQVSRVGSFDLQEGDNIIPITVTSENGDIRTYSLTFHRDLINSARLRKLKVVNYPFTTEYLPDMTSYAITIDNEVTQLNIEYEAEDPNAEVKVIGNENLKEGSNTIRIEVLSSKGDIAKTYILEVYRQLYSNNYLYYLDINPGQLSPVFVKTTMEYTVEVDYMVSSIDITAEADLSTMTVLGTGKRALEVGENKLEVIVRSPSNVERHYFINVTRKQSDDNLLKNLSISHEDVHLEYTPKFNPEIMEYTLVNPISEDIDNVFITAQSNASKIEGIGTQAIKVGDNDLKITVTSDSGIDRVYTIHGNRPASSNANLINITPSSGVLSPTFIYYKDTYDLRVGSEASTLSFEVESEQRHATVTGHEMAIVESGASTRIINVEAEDGTVKKYTINVIKDNTSEARLKSLSFAGYSFEETFDPDVLTYNVTVPNNKKMLLNNDFKYETLDSNATVSISGPSELSTKSDNIYFIQVTAIDGFSVKTYQVNVKREVGNSALLKSISFVKGTLDKSFVPSVDQYTLEVPLDVREFNETMIKDIETEDPNATIEFSPKNGFDVEKGTLRPYEIRVTSEDKQVKKTYTFNVTFSRSINNDLKSLAVDGFELNPLFDANTLSYEVAVPEDQDKVFISASTADVNSRINTELGERELTRTVTKVVIEVQAENGDIKSYELFIRRILSQSLDIQSIVLENAKDAVLTPDFSNDKTQYEATIATDVETVSLKIEKGYEDQTVELFDRYNNPVDPKVISLNYGRNDYMVIATNSYGDKRIYNVSLYREGSDDNYLDNIVITNPVKALEFNRENTEYYIEVDNTVNKLELTYVLSDPHRAYAEVINNTLSDGNNDIVIRVTSQTNKIKDYVIHVFKEPEFDSYLKAITVSDNGVVISDGQQFTPRFNRAHFNYTVTVPGTTNSVLVEGVPNKITTSISGMSTDRDFETVENGIVLTLRSGNNNVTLTGTDQESGQVSVYTINIIRELSSDFTLVNLIPINSDTSEALSFDDNVEFSPTVTTYMMHVPSTVNNIHFNTQTLNPKAIISVHGNKNLVSGENRIVVTVTSEDRSRSKAYFITVIKDKSEDNNLTSLMAKHGSTEKTFDIESGLTEFEYTVDTNQKTITLLATPSDPFAEVNGTGEYALDYGINALKVIITAQNGDVKTYTVNVNRPYDLRLSNLVTTHGQLLPKFDPEHKEYSIWVPVETTKLSLMATPMISTTQIEGTGWKSLELGENIFEIRVVAPNGDYNAYSVVITRSASTNNYLQELSLGEGVISPAFNKDYTQYETYVSDIHDNVTLSLIPEDSKAVIEILDYSVEKDADGNYIVKDIKDGANNIDIKVTAEDKSERTYHLIVHRQPAALFSNRLSSLTVEPISRMSPQFKPNTTKYVANVATDTTEVTIRATKESDDATIVSGVGTFPVLPGKNVYKVIVMSKDGIVRTYQITINQALSADATLKDISFAEGELTPIYSKTRDEYVMTVPGSTMVLTPTIVPSVPGTTWTITGDGIDNDLKIGKNVVTINTVAPNKKATKTYTINVFKSAYSSVELKEITSSSGTFMNFFDPTGVIPYELQIEDNVNSLILEAEAVDPQAIDTIEGLGVIDMSNEVEKNVNITVRSKAGNTMTYVVKITKKVSPNVLLSQLGVVPGNLSPNFNELHLNYMATYSFDVEQIEIFAKAKVATSMVTGTGVKTLDVGENKFDVVVTAFDGTTGVYNVNAEREAVVSSNILSMHFKEAVIRNPMFNKDTTEYHIRVPYETENLTINDLELEDPVNASYTISGNTNLTVGVNEVKVLVENRKDGSSKTYIFTVTRDIFVNNYLKSLKIKPESLGLLSPAFDPYQNNYEITIPYDVTSVQIEAKANDPAIVSYFSPGDNLQVGINELHVTVTYNNVPRDYIIRVIRKANSENKIPDLIIDGGVIKPGFDPDYKGPYEIEVGEDTDKISFEGTVPEGAKVIGMEEVVVGPGETKHTITVIAEDGTERSYEFIIKRPVSSDASVTNIIPSVGAFTTNFQSDVKAYEVIVDDTVTEMSFDVKTRSKHATVTGHEKKLLTYGENTFEIKISSEDKQNTETYLINVIRGKTISKITINETLITMNVGGNEKIDIAIEPEDATDKEVEWSSTDDTIVTVDNAGNISAIKEGGVVIEVRSKKNPNVRATVNVEVLKLSLESSTLDIVRKADITDPPEDLKDYVIGSEPNTTIESYKAMFENEANALKVYDSSGTLIEDETQLVGTGMTLKLEVSGKVYDEVVVIVRGDANGDGNVDLLDYAVTRNLILGDTEENWTNTFCLDLNRDQTVDLLDYALMRNYILGDAERLN